MRHPLTVKQLRKELEGLADDMPVVTQTGDHAYRYVGVFTDFVENLQQGREPFGEWYDEAEGPKVDVLIVW